MLRTLAKASNSAPVKIRSMFRIYYHDPRLNVSFVNVEIILMYILSVEEEQMSCANATETLAADGRPADSANSLTSIAVLHI